MVTVLRAFTNVLEGLVVMAQPPGLVHMDIKNDNIVMELESGRMRLIDYGYICPYADMVSPSRLNLVFGVYDIWPPEWDYLRPRLLQFAMEKEGMSRERAAASVPRRSTDSTNNFKEATKAMAQWGYRFNYSESMFRSQFESAHPMEETASRQEIYAQFIGDFANKLDVFSLGRTIAWVLSKGVEQVPAALQADLRAWIVEAVNPNGYGRFEPELALAQYKLIWADYDAAAAHAGGRVMSPWTPRRRRTPVRQSRSRSKKPRRSRSAPRKKAHKK